MERRRDTTRAAAYVAARRGELSLTQAALADAIGIDVKTVYNLESGSRWPQARNRAAIENGLGWEVGDLQRISDGGEPTPPLRAERETVPQTANMPSRWFLTELRRRKLSLADLTTSLDALRIIADHNGQSLAELLLESGLANPEELTVREQPNPLAEEIARFHREVEGITSSPHLSARQRREIEDQAAEGLQKIRQKRSGDA